MNADTRELACLIELGFQRVEKELAELTAALRAVLEQQNGSKS